MRVGLCDLNLREPSTPPPPPRRALPHSCLCHLLPHAPAQLSRRHAFPRGGPVNEPRRPGPLNWLSPQCRQEMPFRGGNKPVARVLWLLLHRHSQTPLRCLVPRKAALHSAFVDTEKTGPRCAKPPIAATALTPGLVKTFAPKQPHSAKFAET